LRSSSEASHRIKLRIDDKTRDSKQKRNGSALGIGIALLFFTSENHVHSLDWPLGMSASSSSSVSEASEAIFLPYLEELGLHDHERLAELIIVYEQASEKAINLTIGQASSQKLSEANARSVRM
jgi:hypothetical protein